VKCCLIAVFHCGLPQFFLSLANTTRIFEGTRIVKTGMVSLRESLLLSFPFHPAESIIPPCVDRDIRYKMEQDVNC